MSSEFRRIPIRWCWMTGTKLQTKHVIAKDHIFSYFSASYMIVIQFRTIKSNQCLANRCITKSVANWAPIHIILSHSYWNVRLIHPGPSGEITLTDYIIWVRSKKRDSFSNEPWLWVNYTIASIAIYWLYLFTWKTLNSVVRYSLLCKLGFFE